MIITTDPEDYDCLSEEKVNSYPTDLGRLPWCLATMANGPTPADSTRTRLDFSQGQVQISAKDQQLERKPVGCDNSLLPLVLCCTGARWRAFVTIHAETAWRK